MPKKPPPNGYYYFMLDFKRQAERRGRRFHGGMQEVASAASDDWKALSSDEKDYWNKMAKEKKHEPRPNVPKQDERRFNSQGVSFAEIKREKARSEEKDKLEKNFITKFVNDMNLDDLQNKLIYLIHVNIFCKTDSDVYYPAEIGIVKFSLANGIKDVFHRMINPGEIATGYSYEVKEHSDATHKLTLPYVKSVEGSDDTPKLYRDIITFLTVDEPRPADRSEIKTPPLFTMYDDIIHNTSIIAVRKTLKNLYETMYPSDVEDRWEIAFKVYPLPDMFYRLKNKCVALSEPSSMAFPNAVLPRLELQKDTYHYEVNLACKFHQDEDVIVHCSRAFVLRWAYIIRDHCTHYIGVDMFAENAVPKDEFSECYYDDDDDTASVADSMASFHFSEASITFKRDKCGERQSSFPAQSRLQSSSRSDYFPTSGSVREDKKLNNSDSASTSPKSDFGSSSVASSICHKKEDSEANQSIKSCPVTWPNINRRPVQNVPDMNDRNFPSLGRGRFLHNSQARMNQSQQ